MYNYFGLMPKAVCGTMFLIIPLFLAVFVYTVLNFQALQLLRYDFVKMFYPDNLLPSVSPLIIYIEKASYCIRPVSLSLRLFSNMLAGHILLHICNGYIKEAIFIKGSFFFGFFC
jgi:F-type H+-transporting ATPase subunit a